MLKRYVYIVIVFLGLTSCAQNKISLYSVKNKVTPKINIPTAANNELAAAASEFNKNFRAVTGQFLKIERSNSLNKNYNYIILNVNPTQKDSYCISKKTGNITIQGKTNKELLYGIDDFFKRYINATFNEIKNTVYNDTISEINIPNKFNICSSPDFEYREPYFSTNFDPKFRSWNKTNYLELEWGIWGHNLNKILKEYRLPKTAYAKVDNKRIESQYCFTSDSLFKAVKEKVKNIYDSDHTFNKYMILPNDNHIVCTCNTCKAVGNTKTNASPAVFTFLNKLAKNYKNLTFYTAAYITINEVPRFKAFSNVGIFYSTIKIQKGIPIEKTKKFKDFENDIEKWKKYLNNVYIWDYAVNFDNYFDIYPSLKVTQENLKLYKKLGVKGIFIHGSEYNYSAFQDLKATLFAKLLWNTDIDIDEEIKIYFQNKFPIKLAEVLTNYYSFIENSFLISKKELSIYSGINKTVKKYLDPKVFFSFYDEFTTHTEKNKYDTEFLKIATALSFLKLEIMRDYGYGVYGFANLNKSKEIIIKNEVSLLLDKLKKYSKSANITSYNEVNYKLENYINSWKKAIYKYHKRKHYSYKKTYEVISKLDEDYKNIKILNDGAFGLEDYNTNWHISSIDDLVIKIKKEDIESSKKITFSFLQDIKHKIYYPQTIEILDLNLKKIKELNLLEDKTVLGTKEVTINLPTEFDNKQLPNNFIIKIGKHKLLGKNALACDEIIFN